MMGREKEIEEIAKIIARRSAAFRNPNVAFMTTARKTADSIYSAGYRNQSDGEWIAKIGYAGYGYYCSNCNAVFTGENAEWIAKGHIYCPKCGAKMKGGAE